MICELAYASAAEMTQFVTDLKALQDRWPNDFVRVLDDFDAIAYDIFVSKGVPFTAVVQFLQEFGSASETADVAHRLLIPNVKNDTPEEKSAERIFPHVAPRQFGLSSSKEGRLRAAPRFRRCGRPPFLYDDRGVQFCR